MAKNWFRSFPICRRLSRISHGLFDHKHYWCCRVQKHQCQPVGKKCHYFFAFCTMSSFFIIHLLVLMHLWNCMRKLKQNRKPTQQDDFMQPFMKGILAEKLYFVTFLLLISLMLLYFANHSGQVLHASITLEWILLSINQPFIVLTETKFIDCVRAVTRTKLTLYVSGNSKDKRREIEAA